MKCPVIYVPRSFSVLSCQWHFFDLYLGIDLRGPEMNKLSGKGQFPTTFASPLHAHPITMLPSAKSWNLAGVHGRNVQTGNSRS